MTIEACNVPADSLLYPYAAEHYADCYTTTVPRDTDLARYIEAFYNSYGFRPERVLLGFLGRRADNSSTAALATGQTRQFSAWQVEQRLEAELLLADMSGATRSWLRVESVSPGLTRLYFGSAVVSRSGADGQRPPLFQLLTPFHKFYSRVLLAAAVSHLLR